MPARKLGDTPVSDSGTSALPPPKSPVGRKSLTEGGLRCSRPRPETFSDGGGCEESPQARRPVRLCAQASGRITAGSGFAARLFLRAVLSPFCGCGRRGTGFAGCPGL